ncbi:hypothetical protein BS47DRAFT_1361033 [Hydnum rufescens UP504]|uniref:Uncharacterized protein n=1 Tax=Hydnum rufescens UP504 TaxID=1448309 RepID=A0A9P6B0K0_9AGAM|nr:hypothetical protein BS47DRAFT_1361033 [Hydnum rufescens UP504]
MSQANCTGLLGASREQNISSWCGASGGDLGVSGQPDSSSLARGTVNGEGRADSVWPEDAALRGVRGAVAGNRLFREVADIAVRPVRHVRLGTGRPPVARPSLHASMFYFEWLSTMRRTALGAWQSIPNQLEATEIRQGAAGPLQALLEARSKVPGF